MLENSEIIEVYIEDDANSRTIMKEIRKRKIKDEAEIRALVDTFKFSSKRTHQHIADSIVALSSRGIFEPDYPEINAIQIDLSDVL